jgi:hypothetical protein
MKWSGDHVLTSSYMRDLVGQIKNPAIMSCILISYIYDKNLELIQPLVQE